MPALVAGKSAQERLLASVGREVPKEDTRRLNAHKVADAYGTFGSVITEMMYAKIPSE